MRSKLLLIAELNLAELHADRQNELQENLMVEVLDQGMRIILAFFALHGFDPVGVQNGEDEGDQKDHHQPGKGEIFDEPKRLDSLFG